jgi:glycerol-3-phosphate dehydrogenase
LLEQNQSWKTRIARGLPLIEAEIVFCIRHEMAETIEDILARRTGTQLLGWRKAIEAAPRVAELLGQEKQWEAQRCAAAISQYTAKIQVLLNALDLNEAKK